MRSLLFITKEFFLRVLFVAVTACLLLRAASLTAQEVGKKQQPAVARSLVRIDSTLINIGNISMWIYADGISARLLNEDHGVFYPHGTTGVVYQDGYIWGGIVQDGSEPRLRVGGQAYNTGTRPGRIIAKGFAENPDDPNVNRVWRIRRDYQDTDLRQDAAEFYRKPVGQVTYAEVQTVRDRYEKDWNEWPWQKGAPFYDTNGNGVMDAGEEPGIANADQVAWLVYNDLDVNQVMNFAGSPPIGLEVQVTLWAYRRYEILADVIFKQVRIIYKGTVSTPAGVKIDSMYFGQWSDPDIGSFIDDFVGCDTLLNLGYAYNAAEVDSAFYLFLLPPPAVGYVLLAGPLVPASGSEGVFGLRKRHGFHNLNMRSVVYIPPGSPIEGDPIPHGYPWNLRWWNLLRGFWPEPLTAPEPFRDPNGNITKFVYPGDPVNDMGWVDDQPAGDRRMLLASGPFTMTLGDTNEAYLSLVGGLGPDRLLSIAAMKYHARVAQSAFDDLFVLPEPMPTPKLSATELNGEILLSWGESQADVERIEQRDRNGYQFEGYNIYQLPSAQSSLREAVKLATFDRINKVTRIIEERYDPQIGLLVPTLVQLGTNSGVQRTLRIKEDALHHKPLVNGREYVFAVTAYNYNPQHLLGIAAVENAPAIVSVTPHSLNPGVRLSAAMGDTIAVVHTQGSSEGKVTPIVIDPTKLTGDEYKVTFRETASGQTGWNLLNITKGTTILSEMTNQSGDSNYLITDGLQVIVVGPPPGIKQDDEFSNPNHPETWGWSIPSGQRRWTWSGADGFHLEGFRGTIGWGGSYPFNASTLRATQLFDILIKFAVTEVNGNPLAPNDSDISYAYRYLGNASAPPAKPEFAPFMINPTGDFSFQDFKKSVPWAAYVYNKVTKEIGKRLSIGFLENNVAGGLVDGKWWPPDGPSGGNNTAQTGPREWFWIFDIEYSETPNPLLGSPTSTMFSGAAKPIVIWGTVARRGPVGSNADDEFAIFFNRPNSPEDEFSFRTIAPIFDPNKAREDVLQHVNVFPNPYYGLFREDERPANRYVTFSHLPKKAVIRIFTLAGTLVKTIIKDDENQFIRWNLLNENGRGVGNGLYIAHIEMPELGVSKNLKLAVIHQ